MTKKFIILRGRYRFFSSLSFYHGLDMFLATRDALVINGSYPGFFTSSFDKNARQIGSFPQVRGKNKTDLKPPPSYITRTFEHLIGLVFFQNPARPVETRLI